MVIAPASSRDTEPAYFHLLYGPSFGLSECMLLAQSVAGADRMQVSGRAQFIGQL